jgi:hypothetical protein
METNISKEIEKLEKEITREKSTKTYSVANKDKTFRYNDRNYKRINELKAQLKALTQAKRMIKTATSIDNWRGFTVSTQAWKQCYEEDDITSILIEILEQVKAKLGVEDV